MVKYVFAFAWVGAIIYFAISAGGYRRIDLLYNTESGVSVDSAQALYEVFSYCSRNSYSSTLSWQERILPLFLPLGSAKYCWNKNKELFQVAVTLVKANKKRASALFICGG